MRFCLSHYSVIPSDHPVITKFISTCSLSESGELSFDKSNDTTECIVRLVRYKQREAYHLNNIPRKYVLSVTTVHSYEIKHDSELRASVILPGEDITPHLEIEVSDNYYLYNNKGVSSRQRRREGMQLARRRNVRCY